MCRSHPTPTTHPPCQVSVHQDGTFLIADPPTVLAVWAAVEDATTDNGCLHVWPGSHKQGVTRFFQRAGDGGADDGTEFHGTEYPTYEETKDEWVPVPAAPGTIILMHGALYHMSFPNTSTRSRNALTLHFCERDSEWSAKNWLQNPRGFHGWSDIPPVPEA